MIITRRRQAWWIGGAVLAIAFSGSLAHATNADDEQCLCEGSGGIWDPQSCGHYDCGQFPACDAIIPGCDCGPARTFVAGVGCVTDPTCDNFCVADLDDDWSVGFSDLTLVLQSWGPCAACPADLDGNGEVGFADLTETLASWGSCLFDYGPPRELPEAEQIAYEMLDGTGPLIVPNELYDRVVRDQMLIRAVEPELVNAIHDAGLQLDGVCVGLVEGASWDEYDTLNVYYQGTDEFMFSILGVSWYAVELPGNINALALARVYESLDAVEEASLLGQAFGSPVQWTPTVGKDGTWRWNVVVGWLDCQSGCICRRVWDFDVTVDGAVALVAYEEIGPPELCGF